MPLPSMNYLPLQNGLLLPVDIAVYLLGLLIICIHLQKTKLCLGSTRERPRSSSIGSEFLGKELGAMDGLDSLKATELTLGLPGTDHIPAAKGSKRVLSQANEDCHAKETIDSDSERDTAGTVPAAKVQLVGWPPVRSYRVNSIRAKKTEAEDSGGIYVKVRMDGAPYLRKVDLKVYKGYKDLRVSLENMFKCFSLGEGCNGSEYALTYEDKDGDWMLVGDVPWEMFISSCKRMRIMKGPEAKGLSLSP